MKPVINARLQDLQPTASAQLARANDTAWHATDPTLLELCRSLVLTMLEAGAASHTDRAVTPVIDPRKLAALGNWASSDVFSPLERAALGFTEQFVLSVSTVTDEQVEALRAHLDDEAVYNFAAALYLVEMTERLKLVSRAVIGEEAPA